MLRPFPYIGSRPILKQFPPVQQFATIKICAGIGFAAAVWRIAILSFDTTTDTNLISPKLAIEILGLTINPIDKGSKSAVERFAGGEIDTQGYVDLVWCFQNSPEKCNTRFAVTSSYDPPFDAVLGRKDTFEIGMATKQRFLHNIKEYCCTYVDVGIKCVSATARRTAGSGNIDGFTGH